jgi:hypothetical protein
MMAMRRTGEEDEEEDVCLARRQQQMKMARDTPYLSGCALIDGLGW